MNASYFEGDSGVVSVCFMFAVQPLLDHYVNIGLSDWLVAALRMHAWLVCDSRR